MTRNNKELIYQKKYGDTIILETNINIYRFINTNKYKIIFEQYSLFDDIFENITSEHMIIVKNDNISSKIIDNDNLKMYKKKSILIILSNKIDVLPENLYLLMID